MFTVLVKGAVCSACSCAWEKSEGKTYAKKGQVKHEDTFYSVKQGCFFEVFSLPYLIFVTFVVIYKCVSKWNRSQLFCFVKVWLFPFLSSGHVSTLKHTIALSLTASHGPLFLIRRPWPVYVSIPSWGCEGSFLRKFLCLRHNLTQYTERPSAIQECSILFIGRWVIPAFCITKQDYYMSAS